MRREKVVQTLHHTGLAALPATAAYHSLPVGLVGCQDTDLDPWPGPKPAVRDVFLHSPQQFVQVVLDPECWAACFGQNTECITNVCMCLPKCWG